MGFRQLRLTFDRWLGVRIGDMASIKVCLVTVQPLMRQGMHSLHRGVHDAVDYIDDPGHGVEAPHLRAAHELRQPARCRGERALAPLVS